jgi:hypothetical protein
MCASYLSQHFEWKYRAHQRCAFALQTLLTAIAVARCAHTSYQAINKPAPIGRATVALKSASRRNQSALVC